MNTTRSAVASVLLLTAGHAVADRDDRPISGQVIAEFQPGSDIAAFNADYGTQVIDAIPNRSIYLLRLPGTMTRDQFELLTLGDVRLDKFEMNVSASDPGGDTRSFYGSSTQGGYAGQATSAALSLGPAHTVSTGQSVIVALLDTGIDADHQALAGAVLPGWDHVSDSADTGDHPTGTDSNGNGIPDEFVGHGTMIAGMIRLVAPDAQLLPLNVLDSDGRATSFRVAKAIYDAIDRQVDVINLSLGTSVDTFVLLDAVDEARRHWIPVVAAAGNYGAPVPEQFPAAMQDNRTIAVAATDWAGVLADFSSLGEHVIVSAPGIDTIGPFGETGYRMAEGTSFATAWVTGAIALLKPLGWDTSPGNLSRVLERSAEDIRDLNPGVDEDFLGGGLLDVNAAIARHLNEPGCPADLNDDEILNGNDFFAWVVAFGDNDFAADQNRDRQLNGSDFFSWVVNFAAGCP